MQAASAHQSGWRYGLLGLPLAFVSLPLYVLLPRHYAEHHAVPLATLGALLLMTRLLDAMLDPALGRWADRLFARNPKRSWQAAGLGAAVMALGFAALWAPPQGEQTALLVWLASALVVTYIAFSLVSIVHQTWAARWGGHPQERTALVAWREGAALAGVLLASVLPGWAGLQATSVTLALALALGLWTLHQTLAHHLLPSHLNPIGVRTPHTTSRAMPALADTHHSVWRDRPFVALLIVFLLNGSASAMPATLLPFFVRDSLQAAEWEPLFLASYFLAAAIGLPLWVQLVKRWGLVPSWLVGMALSVAAFCAVPALGPGDALAFEVICLLTGLALGADLTIPAAILTGLIHQSGRGQQDEGQFFGWWTAATKLNLALASGLALPLLGWLGFKTGVSTPENLSALAWTYGVLPCLFKVAAGASLLAASRRYPILKGQS